MLGVRIRLRVGAVRDAEDGVEQSLVGELRAHGAHLVRVRVRVRVRPQVRVRVRVGVRVWSQ